MMDEQFVSFSAAEWLRWAHGFAIWIRQKWMMFSKELGVI